MPTSTLKPKTVSKTRRTRGLKPADRAVGEHSNQWTANPKQLLFMNNWLDPKSTTFANAYQSALAAGYSEPYAAQITAEDTGNKWIREYMRMALLQPEHIIQKIQSIATGAVDSKSPDDTRLRALELLAKLSGMLIERREVTAEVLKVELGADFFKGHLQRDSIEQR